MESDKTSQLEKRKTILSEQLKRESKEVRKMKATIMGVSQKKQRIISQIQFISEVAVDRVRNQEEQLVERVEELSEAQVKQLESDIEASERRTSDCNKQIDIIHRFMNYGNVSETYQSLLQIDIPEFTSSGCIDDITFCHDLDKVNRALASVHLGEIKVMKQTTMKAECPAPVLIEKIQGKTKQDTVKPNLLDLTMMFIDGKPVLLVVDLDNRCIKSFSLRENNSVLLDTLKMENYPFGMTKVNDVQIMVTLPISKLIHTIEITPEFNQVSVMKTRRKYYSIAFMRPSTLAAGCCYPVPSVDFLDMQGHVTHSVQLFDKPVYMCVANSTILASDWKRRSVTCLSKEGYVLWQYKPTGSSTLRCVYGITSNTNGGIIMADRDACKVIQLSQKRDVVRDILTAADGLHEPQGVCLEESKGNLYVCSRSCVRIFKMLG